MHISSLSRWSPTQQWMVSSSAPMTAYACVSDLFHFFFLNLNNLHKGNKFIYLCDSFKNRRILPALPCLPPFILLSSFVPFNCYHHKHNLPLNTQFNQQWVCPSRVYLRAKNGKPQNVDFMFGLCISVTTESGRMSCTAFHLGKPWVYLTLSDTWLWSVLWCRWASLYHPTRSWLALWISTANFYVH